MTQADAVNAIRQEKKTPKTRTMRQAVLDDLEFSEASDDYVSRVCELVLEEMDMDRIDADTRTIDSTDIKTEFIDKLTNEMCHDLAINHSGESIRAAKPSIRRIATRLAPVYLDPSHLAKNCMFLTPQRTNQHGRESIKQGEHQ